MLATPYISESRVVNYHGLGPTMSDDRLLERVMQYDNLDLRVRLQEKMHLTPETALVLFGDLKRFMYLCGSMPGRWNPTREIDEAWHHFILFTKDYEHFCQQCFGRFIHHEPRRVGKPSNGVGVNHTRMTAQSLFGPLSSNWQTENDKS